MGGREVRRVPKDWVHPTQWDGYDARRGPSFEPLMGRNMIQYAEEGEEIIEADYMPDWKPEEMTHYQMYEEVSEGTPMSPVMETPEELAQWLVDNRAGYFAYETTDYETWMKIIDGASPYLQVKSGEGPKVVVQ